MPIELDTKLSRNLDILHASVGRDELVMMSIASGRYYAVNAVGARVWELLATARTIKELCAEICDEFDVDPATCQVALTNLANDLVDNGVVHASTE